MAPSLRSRAIDPQQLAREVQRDLALQLGAEATVPPVTIRLSTRRKKTVAVREEGDGFLVMSPAAIGEAELHKISVELVGKALKSRRHTIGNHELAERAAKLNNTYLGGRATIGEIKFVTNMNTRWGSCSVQSKRIRIAHQLQDVPGYVLDAVIIHELIHTFVPNHGAEFHRWEERTPQLEKAQGYLEAFKRWGMRG
ncbi:M48 family metallopeptidase [uncultured Corynebacterium sp.]|uniref:M48 family metallopeptidase n=1 Tax=uncultured Corynebacterium sp. TaxID=159447 RepID=UPI0025D198F7|nr:M48 family metallopeptidase [uncultured Corynebacterium sp.]